MSNINDIALSYNPYKANCNKCVHFIIDHFICSAFPKGIPVEILEGSEKHLKVLKNQDNKMVFTKK